MKSSSGNNRSSLGHASGDGSGSAVPSYQQRISQRVQAAASTRGPNSNTHKLPPIHQPQSSSSTPHVRGAAPLNRSEHFAVTAAATDLKTTDVLRQWDKGSRNQRIAILRYFIHRHRNSTAAEIEKDLGHGAMLLFTHITAWLRLSYPLGYEISVQLSAIALFLQGQKFLTNFLEIGGVQMLTDVLMLPPSKDAAGNVDHSDKQNCLLLLLHISNSGRVYREMICDGAGTDCIVKASLEESDERTLELTAALFLSLGQGNPRKATLVHAGLLYVMLHGCDGSALCAATTLRSLQMAKEQHIRRSGGSETQIAMIGAENGQREETDALLTAFFHLLGKDDVKLRFEGTELISIAAKNAALTLPVLGRCLDVLDDDELGVRGEDEDISTTVRVQRKQTACGRAVLNILLRPHSEDSLHRIVTFMDRRSGHVSLVKYLRLTETKDVGATVDCARAIQFLCRGASGAAFVPGRFPTKCAKYICDVLGPDAYEPFVCDPIGDAQSDKLLAAIKQRVPEQVPLAIADLTRAANRATPFSGDDTSGSK